MIDINLKLAVIAALRSDPDFGPLPQMRSMNPAQSRRWLRWLEISGLAFHFLERLRGCGKLAEIPPDIAGALGAKLEANSRRMDDMFMEFRRVNERFRATGIRHAFLKGFSLIPRFCPAQKLRHQTDIDILVAQNDLAEAGWIFEALGYGRASSRSADEHCYATPRDSIPSVAEDLYQIQPHREAELHTSIWESEKKLHVNMVVPECVSRSETREYNGVEFRCLAPDDAILLQLLHAFRHLLGQGIRLSWLWELHYFMCHNAGDAALWNSVRVRAGYDPHLRNGCGLIVRLTEQLFGSPVSPVLREWCADPLPSGLQAWVDPFGIKWALAGMQGNKLSLFVHASFVAERRTRIRLALRQLIPLAGRPSLGVVASRNVFARFVLRLANVRFALRRLRFHLSSVVPLCVDFVRWRRAWQVARLNRVARNPGLAGHFRGRG